MFSFSERSHPARLCDKSRSSFAKESAGAWLLSIKRLEELDKVTSEPLSGVSGIEVRAQPSPDGRRRGGSQTGIKAVLVICDYFSNLQASALEGDKKRQEREWSEFEGRSLSTQKPPARKTVTIWGAHFFSVPQGQVFGPSGIYGGLWPPLRSRSAADFFFFFFFLLHLCAMKCPHDTSFFDWLYSGGVISGVFFFPHWKTFKAQTDTKLSCL